MTSSDFRASKITSNDTKLEPISLELNAGNPLFIVCVGVRVQFSLKTWLSNIKCLDHNKGRIPM